MRLICAWVVLSGAMISMSPTGAAERAERIQAASEAVEPFRVIGNIYYVGGQYGSYLITTPEGHILRDTGTVFKSRTAHHRPYATDTHEPGR